MTSLIAGEAKARRPAGTFTAALERPRKGVQAAVGIFLSKKIPSLACRFRVADRGDGILFFGDRIWSAPAIPIYRERRRSGWRLAIRPSRSKAPSPLRSASALQTWAIVLIPVLVLTSCSRIPSHDSRITAQTHEVTDEAGRHVVLPLRIDRIVSLAPNLTEIVYAVGAGDKLVGDTTYCDYPEAAKSVAKIGDTMHPSVERIIALKPQVVLVSTASQLEAFTKQLEEQHIAVYVTNPHNLDEVFTSISNLGSLLNPVAGDDAHRVVDSLVNRTEQVAERLQGTKPVRVFYQVSGEPLYTIGRDAYLTDLISRAGGVSVTADVPTAFPRFSDEAAFASKPDAIILPTGGSMGEANSDVAAPLRKSPAVLSNRVYKINDDHLSRPGPRLVDGLEEIAHALHPEAFG